MKQLDLATRLETASNAFRAVKKNKYSFFDSEYGQSILDIIEGTKLWRLWVYMAMADIRRRYRRTILGPFWTTLSLAVFIGAISVLFSHLWGTDMATFLPFFSSGFICWTFVSSIVMESCSAFIAGEGLFKQVSLPYTTFAWLIIMRNLIVLAHHMIVYALIALLLHIPVNANLFLLIPGMLMLCLTGLWVAIIVGLMCARYRDLQQVISSFLQISLFVTPIFWPPSQLVGTRALVLLDMNPLYHYISIVRLPLLGQAPELNSWFVVTGIMGLGWLLAVLLFSAKRRKLIFWL